jgi:hypothetical protein
MEELKPFVLSRAGDATSTAEWKRILHSSRAPSQWESLRDEICSAFGECVALPPLLKKLDDLRPTIAAPKPVERDEALGFAVGIAAEILRANAKDPKAFMRGGVHGQGRFVGGKAAVDYTLKEFKRRIGVAVGLLRNTPEDSRPAGLLPVLAPILTQGPVNEGWFLAVRDKALAHHETACRSAGRRPRPTAPTEPEERPSVSEPVEVQPPELTDAQAFPGLGGGGGRGRGKGRGRG